MMLIRVRELTLRWKLKELVCVARGARTFRLLVCAYWTRTHYHSLELYLSRHIWICGLTSSVRKPTRTEAGFSVLGFAATYVPTGKERKMAFLKVGG